MNTAFTLHFLVKPLTPLLLTFDAATRMGASWGFGHRVRFSVTFNGQNLFKCDLRTEWIIQSKAAVLK
jgi:hypothetical protein